MRNEWEISNRWRINKPKCPPYSPPRPSSPPSHWLLFSSSHCTSCSCSDCKPEASPESGKPWSVFLCVKCSPEPQCNWQLSRTATARSPGFSLVTKEAWALASWWEVAIKLFRIEEIDDNSVWKRYKWYYTVQLQRYKVINYRKKTSKFLQYIPPTLQPYPFCRTGWTGNWIGLELRSGGRRPGQRCKSFENLDFQLGQGKCDWPERVNRRNIETIIWLKNNLI